MRQEVMAQDAFYALHEVFLHSACSERQFLNLLDSKLANAIEEARELEVDSLPSLNYLKEILYHHLKYNQHVASFIRSLEGTRWPQMTGEKQRRRSSVILDHFEHLATQAQMLYSRCEGAITVLMNSISIAEARKSISQAERLGRLTFLAFIFVPLSFTTSVFGMNLEELSQPNLPSIRIWFALSIPVMVFALLLFYINVGQYARRMFVRPLSIWHDLRLRRFGV
jgi:Mg2+ and Co2+ transporter CorA